MVWRRWSGGVADDRVAYLTIDDGPVNGVTDQILDVLVQRQIKATFFCVGDNIRKYPDLFQRIIDEGHSVGNHTYHHCNGLTTSTKTFLSDVAECEAEMEKYGVSTKLFRPPHGKLRPSQKRALQQKYEIVLWDVLTHDYNPDYSPRQIVEIVKRYTRVGSIINFHDSIKARDNVLNALPECVDWLISEGYQLLTL